MPKILCLKNRAILGLLLLAAGCASTDQDLTRITQEQALTIRSLKNEVERLNRQLDELMQARQDLVRAKSELEWKLQDEMNAGDLSVSMQEKGLVVTVLDRVLFDSGKATLKPSSEAALSKVAEILKGKVRDQMIYVEGHTDNVPIQQSGWPSNWELSTARALEVIYYFIEAGNLVPERLAVAGYGEFHPVADNGTSEGQMNNRRVEIVISPKKY